MLNNKIYTLDIVLAAKKHILSNAKWDIYNKKKKYFKILITIEVEEI